MEWYEPRNEYDTYFSVLHSQQLEITEFYAMNPSVTSDCRGMSFGTYYCVSTYASGYPAGFPGFIVATSSAVSCQQYPSSQVHPREDWVSTPSPIQTGMVSTLPATSSTRLLRTTRATILPTTTESPYHRFMPGIQQWTQTVLAYRQTSTSVSVSS